MMPASWLKREVAFPFLCFKFSYMKPLLCVVLEPEWQQLERHLHRGGRGVCLAGGPL